MLLLQKSIVEGMRAFAYRLAMYEDLAHGHSDEEQRNLYEGYVDLRSLASVRVEPGQAAQYREAVRVQLPVNVVWSAATVSPPQVTIVLRNPTD